MNFAVLGAGALGTILGAHLTNAGHHVVVLARGERARVLRRDGLVVQGLVDLRVSCDVVENPQALRETGTLIVATKAIDTERSLSFLSHLRLESAFSVQNGVLKNKLLSQAFGADAVLGAMADFSGELLANGQVRFTRNVCLYIGEPAGGLSARAETLAAAIDAAGVRAVAASDIVAREWSKFAGWLAQFSMGVLTRLNTWKFLVDENGAALVVRMVREAAQLASAEGVDLIDLSPLPVPSLTQGAAREAMAIVQDIGNRFLQTAPEHRISALQDVLRGSPLEVEETLGFALQRAAALGIETPTLETCYRFARTINDARQPGSGNR